MSARGPDLGEDIAAPDEPAAVEPDGGERPPERPETPALPFETTGADSERAEAAALTQPRRRTRTRRRRAAQEQPAAAEIPASDAGVAVAPPRTTAGSSAPNGVEEYPTEILPSGEHHEAASEPAAGPERASDNGQGVVAETDATVAKPPARRTRRRRTSARSAEEIAPADVPDAGEPAEFEQQPAPVPNEPEMPAAAVVPRGDAGPPRRGWWSRFVRKDE